jgi:Ca2+/H+ antiporter, TMEM165/GDT1 family
MEEVEEELQKSRSDKGSSWLRKIFSAIVVEAFSMTFFAEWGDRSQITTISLAASQDVFGVTLGGCIGHVACTGAAVLGGKQLASVIDEKTVNLVGGIMFILFGAFALYEGPHAAE